MFIARHGTLNRAAFSIFQELVKAKTLWKVGARKKLLHGHRLNNYNRNLIIPLSRIIIWECHAS